MNERNNHNNEADLLDFFSIIAKRKKMILCVFFIFVIVATIVVLLRPKKYIVSQILRLPTAGINQNLVGLEKIKEKIEKGIYDYKINEELELYPVRNFDFDANTAKEENSFIRVNLLVKEKDLDSGPRILNGLFLTLKSENEPIVKTAQNKTENEIHLLKNKISRIKLVKERIDKDIQIKLRDIEDKRNEKNSLATRIKLIEEREVLLLEELKPSKEDTAKLMPDREKILENPHEDIQDGNILQENLYINQLNNQLNSLRKRWEQLWSRGKQIDNDIKRIEKEITDLKDKETKGLDKFDIEIENNLIKISKLKAKKQYISNFVQLQPPVNLPYPITAKEIRKVIAAGMIGLAFGVFLAFCLEFWQKVKTIKS